MSPVFRTATMVMVGAMIVMAGAASTQATSLQQGDAVLLRMAPPVGQISRYQLLQEVSSTAPGTDTLVVTMRQEIFMTQTILTAEAEARRFEAVIDSVRIETPVAPGMAAMMPDMSGLRQLVTASTRGELLATELDETSVAAELKPFIEGLSQGMTGLSMELPEEPIRPGDTWTTDQRTTMDVAGVAVTSHMAIRYRLDGIDHEAGASIAVVSFVGTLQQELGGAAGEAAATGGMDGEISGTAALDLDAGRIIRMSNASEMAGNIGNPMGGSPLPMAMRMNQTMELVRNRR